MNLSMVLLLNLSPYLLGLLSLVLIVSIYVTLTLFAPLMSPNTSHKMSIFIIFTFSLLLALFTVLLSLLFSNILLCENVEELPTIMEINNLHLTESLKEARINLNGASGIYCLINQDTGTIYIGSSVNLYDRILNHLTGNSSNLHLQNAILKYSLAAFTFKVIEQCSKSLLLEREQYWLDWLFSLPRSLRYNFLPTAGSRLGLPHTEETKAKMRSRVHSDETKAKMSATKKGQVLAEEVKVKISLSRGGSPVFIYDANTFELLSIQPSARAAGRYLNIADKTVTKYIKLGSVYCGYLFRASAPRAEPGGRPPPKGGEEID